MSLRAGMVVVILASLHARADEPAAPLETSRQELKALQKGQAQGGDTSLGKITDGMPSIQTPGAEVLPFDTPKLKRSEMEQKKKKEAQKNWLLDGMDKLDKPPKGKDADRKNAPVAITDEDKDKPDQNDPHYLLTLYSDQQKNAEAKADARQPKTVRSDPMTPFLQGWLADSPVRGKFFDEYIKRPDSGMVGSSGGPVPTLSDSGAVGPILSGLDLGGAGSRNVPSGPQPVRPNPYLQGLDLSALQDMGSGSRQPSTNPVLSTGPVPPAPSLADPVPVSRPPDKKQQLPLQTDDKKYFPQLNKF